ncbi:MAG: hypothetical protein HY719_11070 [Planctomycetes bacterium]|nr:hypothetical protein [Planctomycetota bacterium]
MIADTDSFPPSTDVVWRYYQMVSELLAVAEKSAAASGGLVTSPMVGDVPVFRPRSARHELDIQVAMILVTVIEGDLQADLRERQSRRLKDALSRSILEMARTHASARGGNPRFSLRSILGFWRRATRADSVAAAVAGVARAVKFRDWVAHGRFWPLPVDSRCDPKTVKIATDRLLLALSPFRPQRRSSPPS